MYIHAYEQPYTYLLLFVVERAKTEESLGPVVFPIGTVCRTLPRILYTRQPRANIQQPTTGLGLILETLDLCVSVIPKMYTTEIIRLGDEFRYVMRLAIQETILFTYKGWDAKLKLILFNSKIRLPFFYSSGF